MTQENENLTHNGAPRCHAKAKRSGERCRAPSMDGQKVCHKHGGATPQAKRAARIRMLELVDPAIATLAREMTMAEKSSDRQSAANSILDRTGHGRHQNIEVDDAKTLLYKKLLEARGIDADDIA